MNYVEILPSRLRGEIHIPPSKSISHRAIICAGLSDGITRIKNIILSEDIHATIEGIKSFGAQEIDVKQDSSSRLEVIVKGTKKVAAENNVIDSFESGSTLRFLLPLATLTKEEMTFIGRGKLVERPLKEYYRIFEEQNIKYSNNNGRLPLSINGKLKAGDFKIKGNVSSQFISGLMFTLPLLDGNSKIILTTELQSKGYVDLTMDVLKKFSINIENYNYKEFFIDGNQEYKPRDYTVEGDFSQAAFWLVAGLLGENISATGLNLDSLQGDKIILEVIDRMGGTVLIKDNHIRTEESKTRGIVIDASQCPDLVPILGVLGSVSHGTTKIINAERLRIKESDRLKAIATELTKLGADINETDDGLIIQGKDRLKGGLVDSWQDHRIAMALAVASIKCTEPVIIKNSSAVKKSYPHFWKDFTTLGGRLQKK